MQELISDMTGIEKIRSRILLEARTEAEEYVKKAAAQAGEFLKKAHEESSQKRMEILDQARQDAVAAAKKRLALHDMEIRKEILRIKRELIGQTFGKVLEGFKGMPQEKYSLFLSGMLSGVLTDGKFQVILSERDRACLGEEIVRHAAAVAEQRGLNVELALSEDTSDMAGGFILKKGDVEVNYSLEALLRSGREELEKLICEQLELEGVSHAEG